MTIEETGLKGCFILKPEVYRDERGYFLETFNQSKFEKITGQKINFIQDNQSSSRYGTIRGLHFQTGHFAQAKLIRVISGRVLDVAVDLRKDSPTYGRWFGIELSENNFLQLFIPRGFAHGFSVLEDDSVIAYKCDQFYHKAAEAGIHYQDPGLKIDWKIPEADRILSERDKALPFYFS